MFFWVMEYLLICVNLFCVLYALHDVIVYFSVCMNVLVSNANSSNVKHSIEMWVCVRLSIFES